VTALGCFAQNVTGASREVFRLRTMPQLYTEPARRPLRLHRQAIPFLHEPKANIGLAAPRAPMTNVGRDERHEGQRPEVNLATDETDLPTALAP
jgi:hypothetical protein